MVQSLHNQEDPWLLHMYIHIYISVHDIFSVDLHSLWSTLILRRLKLDKYDFFCLRNKLDRNQFLLGNDNEWIIPDLFKVFYSNTSSGVQSCGSIEPV